MTLSTLLRLEGRDAIALLHRIGTQKLDDLAPGGARATLFCDFRGRLLHRAVAGVTRDGAVWLLRDDAPGAELAAFLDRHVFRDDVRIVDHSARFAVQPAPPGAGGPALEEDGGVPRAALTNHDVLVVRDVADARPVDPGERVRAARPAHGHEIVAAFTPFEVGLAHDVHLDKGCFTGQEALMRLVTYRSVRRRLARIGGDGAPPPAPTDLRDSRAGAEGPGAVGVLTSAVADSARWIGLAVVRNDALEPPRPLTIAGGAATDPPEPLPETRALGRP
ncbi:MAG: hypothetical protein HY076_09615 [Candidatus Eisenbacteria bacterium]|uniref:Aminomethyltransferase folate-binding domain-containing protein n=1 Tax=Eiseniibacteriota bacterium TaxID=2212470 RepID=A0A9D6QJH5_UNCEI|nr:hypothetical protein [Candidatus Eisenbacteria bacterium]MBI3540517.1 hypothetical protein [Candidatus Eisenbacteria bacterium]